MSIRRFIGGLLVGASALGVSGCFSLDPKPFTLDIPAGQLRVLDNKAAFFNPGAAGASPAPAAAAEAPAQPAIEVAAAAGLASPNAMPEHIPPGTDADESGHDDEGAHAGRGDHAGQGDHTGQGGHGGAPVDRVVVSARREAPRRVPDYSPDETASLICLMQKIGFDDRNARKAHEATLAARDMRAAMASGRADPEDADAVERRRQDAVKSALSPLPVVDIFFSPIVRKSNLPKPSFREIAIDDVVFAPVVENGRDVTIVSGVVRNTGKARAELPPVTLEALDAWDFVLSGQSSLMPFQFLDAGESRPFELRFVNPPKNTSDVYVHFAPPFRYRWPRDCAFFDQVRSTSDTLLNELPASTSKSVWQIIDDQLDAYTLAKAPEAAEGEAANSYSASELNALTRYFRREAAWAWDCRESARAGCAGVEQRLQWRDMFAIAEAADEAWDAVQVFNAKRKAQADDGPASLELAEADRVRRDAVRVLAGLGDAALRRAGTSVPDVAVDVTESKMKLDSSGLYLEVAGRINNGASETRQVEALVVALVDRFGLPLSSMKLDAPAALEAGQSQEFRQRIPIRRGGSQPALSTRTTGVMGRAPPEDIAWQIRVGAMAKSGEAGAGEIQQPR